MKFIKRAFLSHPKTTLLGLVSIAFGLWSASVVYVPSNTVRFNLLYVLPAQLALVIVGLALICAADHKD